MSEERMSRGPSSANDQYARTNCDTNKEHLRRGWSTQTHTNCDTMSLTNACIDNVQQHLAFVVTAVIFKEFSLGRRVDAWIKYDASIVLWLGKSYLIAHIERITMRMRMVGVEWTWDSGIVWVNYRMIYRNQRNKKSMRIAKFEFIGRTLCWMHDSIAADCGQKGQIIGDAAYKVLLLSELCKYRQDRWAAKIGCHHVDRHHLIAIWQHR